MKKYPRPKFGWERTQQPESERTRQNRPIPSELKITQIYQKEPVNETCWAYMKLLRESNKTKKVYPVDPYVEVYQFRDNLYGLLEESPMGMGDVWMYLTIGPEKALLVDSGFGAGNIKEAVGKITDLPVMLVNTHADKDHIGCNKLFDVSYMHPSEFDRYHQTIGTEFMTAPLLDGDIIDIGDRQFEIIPIPGHSPGSIALLDADNKILIGGDSVQNGMVFMFGPDRDINTYIKSINKLTELRRYFETVYASHGSFSVDADIIYILLRGAEHIRDGAAKGIKAPYGISAKLYELNGVKFLY